MSKSRKPSGGRPPDGPESRRLRGEDAAGKLFFEGLAEGLGLEEVSLSAEDKFYYRPTEDRES